jgi:hypothetical protein
MIGNVVTSTEKTLWLDVKVILVHPKILRWLFLHWLFYFSYLIESIRVLVIIHSSRDMPQNNISVYLIASVFVCLSCEERLGIWRESKRHKGTNSNRIEYRRLVLN